jgi:pimeloyl-ACP methyl ester carboxylesterase
VERRGARARPLSDAAALVCLHGLGGSADEWRPAAAALGWDHVHAALPPAGAAVVVGHSFGGVEAIRLAAAHADRVQALVLTGAFWPPARDGRTLAAALADYAGHRVAYLGELAGRGRRPRPTAAGARDLAALVRLALRPAAFHAVAARVAAPVLVVHGTLDHLVPIGFARAGARRHPAWTLTEVPGGGHWMHRDRPADWAAIVAAWPGLAPATPPAR